MIKPVVMSALLALATAIPAVPHNYTQLVDHFSAENRATFQQRYYMNETSFGGPGSPILCILGGEGAIEPSTGIFYPSIVVLAERLKALVVEPEHRYYGTSQPQPPFDTHRLQLLTAPQALEDATVFIQSIQRAYKCSGLDGEPRCPVITVGGSYPGWLSMAMRLRYPNVVDIAYSASAPMRFYSQEVGQYDYYRVVTDSAARASPNCPASVRQMLQSTIGAPSVTKEQILAGLDLCTPLPDYLEVGSAALLVDEVSMVATYTFANLNMANYPPGPATGLAAACRAIEAGVAADPWATLAAFLKGYSTAVTGRPRRSGFIVPPHPPAVPGAAAAAGCYNLSSQLPSGANATISAGDWSGVGSGDGGSSWDFETCSLLVEQIGMSGQSDMFLPREWSLEWLGAHCTARFGLLPRPRELADLWGFGTDRLAQVTSRIIFTNGLNDGWSAGGVVANLSDTLLAFNAPNGAHHSDLSHAWPDPATDTADVLAVRELVAETIERWLWQL